MNCAECNKTIGLSYYQAYLYGKSKNGTNFCCNHVFFCPDCSDKLIGQKMIKDILSKFVPNKNSCIYCSNKINQSTNEWFHFMEVKSHPRKEPWICNTCFFKIADTEFVKKYYPDYFKLKG